MWTSVSKVDNSEPRKCFIHGKVSEFQVLLDSLHPRSPGGLLQFSKREAVKIFLASVSSGIHPMWLDRENHAIAMLGQ